MKHLIHTFFNFGKSGSLIKYEIFTTYRKLGLHEKIPEGTYRIVESELSVGESFFKITNSEIDIRPLYEANKPQPNTWYSDGPDRVSLEMIIDYLTGK